MKTRAELKRLAKEQLKGRWTEAVVFLLAIFVFELGVGILGYRFLPSWGGLISLLITGPLVFSLTQYFYKLMQGKILELGAVWDGFGKYRVTVVLFILVLFWSFLWMLPALALGVAVVMITAILAGVGLASSDLMWLLLQGSIWFLLVVLVVVVWGLYVQARYSQVWFLAVKNNKLTPSQVVAQSVALMKGHMGEYIMLELSFLGWAILGLLTFGIGFLFVVPYRQTTMANYFECLRAGAEKKKLPKVGKK
jgi:uncharacterized membrane protein